ncbi:2-hydroxyacid dehydrogenase [Bosea sp. NBC_00550]|uniref:2-hydroxyacid dehydrogenase n=1 Tax=Bosea sp. NBC_00550 TaxID=2969621 RepID=UPI0022328DBE|nr:2-hydroxyacid dehydrogenase [Bosea sp. NBC_00550]UZF93435.1 2-hydroxyacid dehydrogenase [Bosea sp. NBC_00550]
MRIVFHGENAASFSEGFAGLVGSDADIRVLPDQLEAEADRRAYADADVVVGVKFDATLPALTNLRLFHVPGAGYDAVQLDKLPSETSLCNCFGHEQAIAEYVMSALLARHIPLADADQRLRRGDWAYWAGAPDRVHGEIAGKTIGLLGFGHIGKAIARRAKAFEMQVNVANRSPVATSEIVDRSFTLDRLDAFWGSADAIVVSLPLTPETRGIVGADAFAAMRRNAVVFNVGRGPLLDEAALYEALKQERIAGAVIDTWYRYPSSEDANPLPGSLPFHELPNIVMTPHMSGWTSGTIRRRQQTIADNIRRCFAGEPLTNLVREGKAVA